MTGPEDRVDPIDACLEAINRDLEAHARATKGADSRAERVLRRMTAQWVEREGDRRGA